MIKEFQQQFKTSSRLSQLIYINLVVFLGVQLVEVFAFLMKINPWDIFSWFALPAETTSLLKKPWTLISYMFLHQGFLHLLFNMLWLYFGGKIFLHYLNSKQLVSTYVLGGLSGGVLYLLAFNLFPAFEAQLPKAMAIGASASVLAIITAIATYSPNYAVHLTLIGRVKLKHIALISIALDILSIPKGNAGGHIAHLGGALFGFLYVQQLKQGKDWSLSFNKLMDYLINTFTQQKSPLKTAYKRPVTDDQWNKQKADEQAEVNKILEKISRSGYESLSQQEKNTLFDASKK